MAGIALADAQEMLDAYVKAELAVLKGQSYQLGGRTVTRADLEQIRAGRAEWERKVADITATADGGKGGPLGRITYGVPY